MDNVEGTVKDNGFGKQLKGTLMLTGWLLVLMILANKPEIYINLCSLKNKQKIAYYLDEYIILIL
jgi:hypothetical protein